MSIKSEMLVIDKNDSLGNGVYLMRLSGVDFSGCEYGQFLNILVSGFTLRRPFSFYKIACDYVEIVYQVVGDATKVLSRLSVGCEVDVLIGLGTGFELPKMGDRVLLIAGGIGVGPIYGYYDFLKELGYDVRLMVGFRSSEFVIDLGLADYLVLDDVDGNVVEFLAVNDIGYDYYYACGPHRMLEGLAKFDDRGQLLLEAKMACGFGLCMACPVKTTNGYKRVCVEGPMFYAKELNVRG